MKTTGSNVAGHGFSALPLSQSCSGDNPYLKAAVPNRGTPTPVNFR